MNDVSTYKCTKKVPRDFKTSTFLTFNALISFQYPFKKFADFQSYIHEIVRNFVEVC